MLCPSRYSASYCQRLLLFDAIDGTFRSPKLRHRSAQCAICGEYPEITELIDYQQFCGATASDKDKGVHVLAEPDRITPKAYAQMLSEGVPHVLVDVRPEVELDICKLPHPAINIPLASLSKDAESTRETIVRSQTAVAAQSAVKGVVDVPVVCICRRGNDSQFAVQIIQSQMSNEGVKVIDVQGGLYGWSRQVDLEFPVY